MLVTSSVARNFTVTRTSNWPAGRATVTRSDAQSADEAETGDFPETWNLSAVQSDARLGRVLRRIGYAAAIALLLTTVPASGEERGPVKSLLEMRREGVVVQQWDISCGAAALATVLTYQYRDPVPEREIAKSLMRRTEYLENPLLVRVRHGFSFNDLKGYVDSRGYEGIGYGNLNMAHLVEFAPIIVPVRFNGYNHFVVFRGVRAGRVLLADPAWGNRTMPLEKFEDAWLNYKQMGKVGFVVARGDGTLLANRMAPQETDFVLLR